MSDEDPLEAILFTEDNLQKRGFNEGYQHGLKEGAMEGFLAGQKNGWEVASEEVKEQIGYYLGFTEVWLQLHQEQPQQGRVLRVLSALNEKISEFQILNVRADNYNAQLTEIQAKFKQVMSMLKVGVKYKGATDISF